MKKIHQAYCLKFTRKPVNIASAGRRARVINSLTMWRMVDLLRTLLQIALKRVIF